MSSEILSRACFVQMLAKGDSVLLVVLAVEDMVSRKLQVRGSSWMIREKLEL